MTPDEIVREALSALGVDNARPIAQGGQKVVLRGELAGTPVVVKIVPVPPGPSGAIVIERAHREVELLAAVESAFVVKVLSDAVEVGPTPEAVAWVEEELDGGDISRSMSTRWSDDDVFALLSDVGHAIDACHSLDVVHRDLSPGNVRQLASGRFVLMDPGYAKHLQLAAITGVFQPGTPGFRSPEHVPGGNPTSASDVFSLGALAYYARLGQFPIDPSEPQIEYDRRLLHTQATPVLRVDSSVDADLARIIDRCLQRQPARRFLDGRELLIALEEIGRAR